MGRTLRPLRALTVRTSAALMVAPVVALAACGGGGQTAVSTSAAATYPLTPSAPNSPAVSAGSSGSSAPATTPARRARAHVHVVRTVAKRIRVPWGITELPDGEVLIGSRDTGKVSRLDVHAGRRTVVGRITAAVSNVGQGGEAGLLGLAASPHFATDHRIYAYYSTAHDNRIAWMSYESGRLGAPHVILTGIPHGVHHDGGRIAFGPDGMLYAGTGETMVTSLAQDKSSLGGKVLRMTPEGKPAPGNPFGTLVYTYGHRNVEGLAFDPSGRLWASELGDHDVDELNLIQAGHDYGWPATQGKTSNPKYTSPVAQWGTSTDSPSGIAYADGAIWMAALKGERLWRIPLHGTRAGKPRAFLTHRYGRLRSVLALGPHRLLVTTSNRDGRAPAHRGDDRVLLLRVR